MNNKNSATVRISKSSSSKSKKSLKQKKVTVQSIFNESITNSSHLFESALSAADSSVSNISIYGATKSNETILNKSKSSSTEANQLLTVDSNQSENNTNAQIQSLFEDSMLDRSEQTYSGHLSEPALSTANTIVSNKNPTVAAKSNETFLNKSKSSSIEVNQILTVDSNQSDNETSSHLVFNKLNKFNTTIACQNTSSISIERINKLPFECNLSSTSAANISPSTSDQLVFKEPVLRRSERNKRQVDYQE